MVAKWLVILVPTAIVLGRFGLIVRDIWRDRRARAAMAEEWRLAIARGLTSKRLDEYLAVGSSTRSKGAESLGTRKEGC